MTNGFVRRLAQAGLALGLALSLVRSALAQRPTSVRLVLKLDAAAQMEPSPVLAAYPFEQWTPLLVPGWFQGTLSQAQADRSIAEMDNDPNVKTVERDRRVQATLLPDDTHWTQQWGPVQIKAPAAWDVTTGDQSIVIAVLDTGADRDHSDLAGQLWVNPGEVPGNGLDDDGNGQVDDINGWRFGHDADDVPYETNDVNDDHGHGTHVTGIIAARGNNGQGIAGMAWGCRVMIVKVLDQKGDGYYSEVANGLIYATDNGAQVANLSLGGTEKSELMEDAVAYARAHDTVVIAAAGNIGSAVLYPAAYPGAVAVAATDRDDRRLSFSSYGPQIELAAPGSSIYSTCLGNEYCYRSGTSMATPHVAGLAALLRAQHPTDTASQVIQRLHASAKDIASPGWDEYTGWGRIDAQRALSPIQAPQSIYLPIGILGQDPAGSWPWSQHHTPADGSAYPLSDR
jgi:subtilisin family serine protease